MKAVRFFIGEDTYGHKVQVAEGETGEWFARYDYTNKYGLQTSKWETHKPTWVSTSVNQYSGEEYKLETPTVKWGWNKLEEVHSKKFGIRLPNKKKEY
jgi:hypothetical protein